MSDVRSKIELNCPLPINSSDLVKLAHGSGGRMTDQLIEQTFLPNLKSAHLGEKEDAAVVGFPYPKLAFTTDSYVVNPIIFPGGNIGSLAVHGTVNDLSMRGAKPLYISAAFILEEGFSRLTLETIVKSMNDACNACAVELIAADTKVVNKGCGDKTFINTTGIGAITNDDLPSSSRAKPEDVILCSGDIGRHGMAIMAAREGLDLETTIESDSAPLHEMVHALMQLGASVHVLRDITRGGLASVLNEIALASTLGIEITEANIPVNDQVKGACEILGLDPLYVACEGRLVAIVAPEMAEKALSIIKDAPYGDQAAAIGTVVSDHSGRVVMRSLVGGRRIVDKLSGDQLPRIC